MVCCNGSVLLAENYGSCSVYNSIISVVKFPVAKVSYRNTVCRSDSSGKRQGVYPSIRVVPSFACFNDGVQLFFHTCFLDWCREAGPSGTRIEFRVGGEYAVVAADAFVDALVLALVVLA